MPFHLWFYGYFSLGMPEKIISIHLTLYYVTLCLWFEPGYWLQCCCNYVLFWLFKASVWILNWIIVFPSKRFEKSFWVLKLHRGWNWKELISYFIQTPESCQKLVEFRKCMIEKMANTLLICFLVNLLVLEISVKWYYPDCLCF